MQTFCYILLFTFVSLRRENKTKYQITKLKFFVSEKLHSIISCRLLSFFVTKKEIKYMKIITKYLKHIGSRSIKQLLIVDQT